MRSPCYPARLEQCIRCPRCCCADQTARESRRERPATRRLNSDQPRYVLILVLDSATNPIATADKTLSGGPGGSGINLARLHGHNLQSIIDSPLSPNDPESKMEKYFDIVAFDPRGVGFTSPSFACFANAQQRLLWQIASDADGLLGSSDVAFSRIWARKKALAEACDEVGDENISTRMNTPTVAMDMAAIVDALATWRGKKTGKSHRDLDKLQYWGFSYGTLLGETFASMYPHLVGRLVLDGVVDSDRHYAGKYVCHLSRVC